MNKLLFLHFCLVQSQFISITTCSDINCKTNCNSWIATNNKCTDTTPYSITTYTSYTVFSDSDCITVKPNTYSTPIFLDGNCNQLYTYGNLSQSGSYKALNLSLIIGITGGMIVFILIIIVCCLKYFQCCCFKPFIPTPPNTAIIIDTSNNFHQPISYGYPIVDYSNRSYVYNPHLLQPSAPPANNYKNII
jgi:hypothetical protein